MMRDPANHDDRPQPLPFPDVWAAEIDDDSSTPAPVRPPPGFEPVTHGLPSGVYCARYGHNLLSLAITRSVFDELGWPLKSPFTHIPVSYWLAGDAETLAVIRDPMGESLWRTGSNSFSEPLYASHHLPFAHPVLNRLPLHLGGPLPQIPHRAENGLLYLDLGSVMRPAGSEEEKDALTALLSGIDMDAPADPLLNGPVAGQLNKAPEDVLRWALDPARLAALGCGIQPDGSITDRTGAAVLPPGFAAAVRSLIGE